MKTVTFYIDNNGVYQTVVYDSSDSLVRTTGRLSSDEAIGQLASYLSFNNYARCYEEMYYQQKQSILANKTKD